MVGIATLRRKRGRTRRVSDKMPFTVDTSGPRVVLDFRQRWSPLMVILLMELRQGRETQQPASPERREAFGFFYEAGVTDMNYLLTQKGLQIAELLCQQAALLGEGL